MVQEGRVRPLPEDNDTQMYRNDNCSDGGVTGFTIYEVSNFARPGSNAVITKIIEITPTILASGRLPFILERTFDRRTALVECPKHRHYCDAIGKKTFPVAGSESVDKEKMFSEAIFLGLRTGELSVTTFQQLYGVDMLSTRGEKLKIFSDEHLLQSRTAPSR